jgi:hypothetical protein
MRPGFGRGVVVWAAGILGPADAVVCEAARSDSGASHATHGPLRFPPQARSDSWSRCGRRRPELDGGLTNRQPNLAEFGRRSLLSRCPSTDRQQIAGRLPRMRRSDSAPFYTHHSGTDLPPGGTVGGFDLSDLFWPPHGESASPYDCEIPHLRRLPDRFERVGLRRSPG